MSKKTDPRKLPAAKSAICIAQLLSTEGFTDHTAAEVIRYAKKQMTSRQYERFKRIKGAFGEMAKEKMNGRDRIVLGRFMGMMRRLSFDTGLRIGLTAYLHCDPKEIEVLPR